LGPAFHEGEADYAHPVRLPSAGAAWRCWHPSFGSVQAMTPTERAYCELCLAVWQQGILLWAEAITQTFAMLQIETPGAQAKQARALFRVV
jgi:hypothetical protein